MSKFMVDLDEARRERLEAYRRLRGLRSLAEAVRDLIDNSSPVIDRIEVRTADVGAVARSMPTPGATAEKTKAVVAAKPAAKPIKSRLKGEWKAP